MYRKGIQRAALLGLGFCTISGVAFLFNENATSLLYLIALLTVLAASVSSFVAGYLSLRRIRRITPRNATPPIPTMSIRQLLQSDMHLRRRQTGDMSTILFLLTILKPIMWLGSVLVFFAVYILLMVRVMESYVGSIHFGAFVSCLLVPIPFFSLLYGFLSKDERKLRDRA